MKRSAIAILGATLCATLVVSTVHAQWVVYDPTNYAEAVAAYEQLDDTIPNPAALARAFGRWLPRTRCISSLETNA